MRANLLIFELLMGGVAPKSLVFCHSEAILTLDVLIARELFDRGIPVIRLSLEDFSHRSDAKFAALIPG